MFALARAQSGRTSTRQPMCGAHGESRGGGGFQRIVCQLVDWTFSQWSVVFSSSISAGQI
jgi:hypothetical protein